VLIDWTHGKKESKLTLKFLAWKMENEGGRRWPKQCKHMRVNVKTIINK
jgi:hypothetical protein